MELPQQTIWEWALALEIRTLLHLFNRGHKIENRSSQICEVIAFQTGVEKFATREPL